MWNYKIHIDGEDEVIERLSKYSKISGILLMILGFGGILYPAFLSLTTSIFVAWIMLFAGIGLGYFTWMSNRGDISGWLKSFILIVISLVVILYPLAGIATIGLLLSLYFFMDSFASFGLALSLRPESIWWIWLFNASLSMILGLLLVTGWPQSSIMLVGLFVGFSLFFDGLALFMGGNFLNKGKL